jgi:hypothetical protein
MGQRYSSIDWTETDSRVVVGVRPMCFVGGCAGRSRGRQRDNFRDDPGLDTIPEQLVEWLSLEDWLGFVNRIRAFDDSIGPQNKCLRYLMFVPFLGTHLIMLPCIFCNWQPALVRGMEEICNDYAERWKAKNLSVTQVHKPEGRNNGVLCIRIDKDHMPVPLKK